MKNIKLLIILCCIMSPNLSRFGGILAQSQSSAEVYPRQRDNLISITFENADIRTVLRTFASLGGVNIVASENVQGTITLQLKFVPWEQAFQTVLRVHGLTAVEHEGIVGVITMEESKAQREIIDLESKVFRIKYAKADRIQGTVLSVLSERGKAQTDERTNSVVLTDIPAVIYQVGKLIEEVDTPTPQVMIEAKIVEVDFKSAREFGIEWQTGNLDNPGVDTRMEGGVNAPISGPKGSFKFGTLISSENLAALDIQAKLTMLESQDKARILSQPRIAVLDNSEAMILSGKKIPITKLDRAGNTITELYDVALKLTVIPHINPKNQIMLELHTEISDVAAEAAAGTALTILTQEAKTSLMVNDGETAVIGGIIREKKGEVNRGVPYLSRIPLLGRLFKSNSKSSSKDELIIFITPHIIPVEKR